MNIIIQLLAIYGLSFFIKESAGPWNLMDKFRNLLMRNRYVGVWFYKLLSCYFCVGNYAGIVIYLLSEKEWRLNFLICHGLAGGAISLMLDALLTRLFTSSTKNDDN